MKKNAKKSRLYYKNGKKEDGILHFRGVRYGRKRITFPEVELAAAEGQKRLSRPKSWEHEKSAISEQA